MSIPRDNYIGDPDYPAPWTTKTPREGLRDIDEARIVSLAPDVCLTPVGSSIVPIPYPVVDFCGHDKNYTPSVRFTSKKAMVMRSCTTHVHGDKAGIRKGRKSATVESICEPIGHADQVRAEGSHVIRHLDRFYMNSRNTQGEAIFVRGTQTYDPPNDDDPVSGSLVALEKPILLAQASGGVVNDAGGSLWGGGAKSTVSPQRLPSIGRRSRFGAVQILDTILDGQVSRQIIENSILGELDYYAKNPGLGLTSEQMAILAAGADKIRQTALPAADVDLAETIKQQTWDSVHANAEAETSVEDKENSKTVRVSGKLTICFDLPPGMDREEFERQLKEQQEEINKMTADDMAYAQWVIEKAGSTKYLRDYAAQRAARREYQRQLVRQGLSEDKITEAMNLVNATHFLDIVAGGDPSNVGIGRGDVNQELGRQWIRDNRVKALKEEAEKMRNEGRSQEKMDVELVICS